MGRPRKPENAQFPEGVYPSRGFIFWRNPASGDWVKIGREWDKASRDRWVELSTAHARAGTVQQFLVAHMAYREQLVRAGQLSKRTYADNEEYVKPLTKALGRMPAHEVTSRHCAAYLQKRSWQPRPKKGPAGELIEQAPRRAPVRANKELSLLSSAYGWALTREDFPLVQSNPCTGVERNPTRAKNRCPEIWEIEAAKARAPGIWPLIFDFAYICGQRGVDTRLLHKRALQADGIHIRQTKTGAEIIVEWNDELLGVVLGLLAHTDAIEAELHVASPYVIVSRTGAPYTAAGWKTTMYKAVHAAIADPRNLLEEPFSFHDFRARSATDEEELVGTNPQHRLGHRRRATTDDYIRGKRPKRVKPLTLRKAS